MRILPLALATMLIATAPLTARAQDAPTYAASDASASADEQLHGRITSFDGAYDVRVDDERGFVDRVRLHDGTIINPTGLTLAPGMVVSIVGFNSGAYFSANEIDTPYTSYDGGWYYRDHPYDYYGSSIGFSFFFGDTGWWHGPGYFGHGGHDGYGGGYYHGGHGDGGRGFGYNGYDGGNGPGNRRHGGGDRAIPGRTFGGTSVEPNGNRAGNGAGYRGNVRAGGNVGGGSFGGNAGGYHGTTNVGGGYHGGSVGDGGFRGGNVGGGGFHGGNVGGGGFHGGNVGGGGGGAPHGGGGGGGASHGGGGHH